MRPASGGQILFTGVLLCLLMLLWMRAAVIIYALFFGLLPFPGLDHVAPMLFTTPTGWAMLIVGSAVGALFAAFSFAISVFSVPMLLEERVDALTAMGTSMALVWNNLPVMLTWGAIVLVLFLLSLATGLLGSDRRFPAAGPWDLACLSRDPARARPTHAHGCWAHDAAAASHRAPATSCCSRAAPRRGLRQTDSPCRRSIAAPASSGSRRVLGALPGVERARANLSTRRVDDSLAAAKRRRRLIATLDDAGYEAHLHDVGAEEKDGTLSAN